MGIRKLLRFLESEINLPTFFSMIELLEGKLFLIAAIAALTYIYIKYYVYNYWKRHAIPCEAPSIPFGNVPLAFFNNNTDFGTLIEQSYNKFNQFPFHGFYILHQPVIIINDPELIHMVLVKNFSNFVDRGWYTNEKLDPLSNNLFLQPEDKWKHLRNKLTSTFTPARLRKLFPCMIEISNELIKVCDATLETTNIIDIKDMIGRFMTDIITSILYGVNYDNLNNPKSDFRYLAEKSFKWGNMKMLLAIYFPKVLEILQLPFYHKDATNFFSRNFKQILSDRQKDSIIRNDFTDLLIQLMNEDILEIEEKSSIRGQSNQEKNDRLTFLDAAAQAFIFFLAGFETASSVSAQCLHELAKNPYIQEKLQQEIDKVIETSTHLTIDNILEMEYLDNTINETLRLHTPVGFLNRICTKDFPIPGSNYIIPKGMRVTISPIGIYHNSKIFTNPEKFDPFRYSKNNPDSKNNFIDLKFSEGPRSCIGKRMGLIQTKLAIVTLLYNYNFSISTDITSEMKVNTDNFLHVPNNIYIRFEKRNNHNKNLFSKMK